MIRQIGPSLRDARALASASAEGMATSAGSHHDRFAVVTKPWGHEYLWYENGVSAVWILHLEVDQTTSLHCHRYKRTSLLVLQGRAVCVTLSGRFELRVLDGLVLEPGTFHRTYAANSEPLCLMEIETPPDKHDLVRLADAYGRALLGYERASHRPAKEERDLSLASLGAVRVLVGTTSMATESLARHGSSCTVVPLSGTARIGSRETAIAQARQGSDGLVQRVAGLATRDEFVIVTRADHKPREISVSDSSQMFRV